MNNHVHTKHEISLTTKKRTGISPIETKKQPKNNSVIKNRSRTQNSSYTYHSNHNNNNPYTKEQIKSVVKKIVQHQPTYSGNKIPQQNKVIEHLKEQSKTGKKKIQISIPNIKTSLTPKSIDHCRKQQNIVHSTKAVDHQKMFNNSGRYGKKSFISDLKSIFDRKKCSHSKQSARIDDNYNISPKHRIVNSSSHKPINENTTVKFHAQDLMDVRECLTLEQYDKFGDRFPQKFKKVSLLGRGGFSVVWLGLHRNSKRRMAIKQILTKNPHETHLKQIWFGSYFFQKGGQPRQQFQKHIGINNICRLISYEIHTIDSWLYYEVCEQSLGGCLFDLKRQKQSGQKKYKIYYRQLILQMKKNINELKFLIIEVCKALFLMNSHNIVHSDLKTQNILIHTRRHNDQTNKNYLQSLKLIDFGSSFLFTNLKQFSMATPQYMPPQILNYILYQNQLDYDIMMLNKMQKYKNPWVVDIWSLGCIVLQIVSGIPLWMSIPTRIEDTSLHATGLFAVKGRLFNKIINKQVQIIEELDQHLDCHNYSGIQVDPILRKILHQMLSLNPDQRISPFNILKQLGVQCIPERVPFY